MNTETADLRTAPVSAAAGSDTRGILLTLMRREFWEHTALWRVPLIVAGLLAISTIFSVSIDVHSDRVTHIGDPERIMVLNITQDVWAAVIYLVASIVVTFYALDALYTERKDRSILFWKSLPVSDGLTVLSKFLVAVVLVPLGVFVLAIASHLIAFTHLEAARGHRRRARCHQLERGRLAARGTRHLPVPDPELAVVCPRGRRRAAAVRVGETQPAAVGHAAALPRADLRVHRVPHPLHLELHPYRSGGIWHILGTRDGHSVMSEQMRMLNDLNWAGAFTSVNLWLGVLAAAAMLYAAARIRRYRDDT